MVKNVFFLCFIVVIVTGCAVTQSTRYQSLAFTGGYSDTRLGEDMFDVSFQSNSYTKADKANDFCLLRCAELSDQNGYPFFVVISNKERGLTISTQGPFGVTSGTDKPSSHNTIKLFKEKPTNYALAYEAKYIISSIKAKYNLK